MHRWMLNETLCWVSFPVGKNLSNYTVRFFSRQLYMLIRSLKTVAMGLTGICTCGFSVEFPSLPNLALHWILPPHSFDDLSVVLFKESNEKNLNEDIHLQPEWTCCRFRRATKYGAHTVTRCQLKYSALCSFLVHYRQLFYCNQRMLIGLLHYFIYLFIYYT